MIMAEQEKVEDFWNHYADDGQAIGLHTGTRRPMITAPDDWHFLATDSYPFYPGVRHFRH